MLEHFSPFSIYDLAAFSLIVAIFGALKVFKVLSDSPFSGLRNPFRNSTHKNHGRHKSLKIIKPPKKLKINKSTNLTITINGPFKNGLVTCEMKDRLGKFNWSEDRSTTKILGPGKDIGTLNDPDGKYKFTWPITPEELTEGKGTLTVWVCEDQVLGNGEVVRIPIAHKQIDVIFFS